METQLSEKCLVCGKEKPEDQWLDETYEAEQRRFCSAHCQAKFETDPGNYVGETQALYWPLGYC